MRSLAHRRGNFAAARVTMRAARVASSRPLSSADASFTTRAPEGPGRVLRRQARASNSREHGRGRRRPAARGELVRQRGTPVNVAGRLEQEAAPGEDPRRRAQRSRRAWRLRVLRANRSEAKGKPSGSPAGPSSAALTSHTPARGRRPPTRVRGAGRPKPDRDAARRDTVSRAVLAAARSAGRSARGRGER
jgi:hypothetical protein